MEKYRRGENKLTFSRTCKPFSITCSFLIHSLIDHPQITFCLGAMMAISASFWFFVQTVDGRKAVYAIAMLMGSGGSVMLVTSQSLIAQLIGQDKVNNWLSYSCNDSCTLSVWVCFSFLCLIQANWPFSSYLLPFFFKTKPHADFFSLIYVKINAQVKHVFI